MNIKNAYDKPACNHARDQGDYHHSYLRGVTTNGGTLARGPPIVSPSLCFHMQN